MDMNEIDDEIAKLEHSETNWKNCEKLHILYGIKNGMIKGNERQQALPAKESYSYATSEFVSVAQSVPIEHLISVLDEHMLAIKAIYPKEYNLILKKLKSY